MIKITEEDNKGVYVCSQLLSSIKEFKNLAMSVKSVAFSWRFENSHYII